MELLRTAVLIAATITTGLVAGLFYAFACSVMLGLGRADDRTFVEAMQRINVAILNGWFAIGFGGAVVLDAVAIALNSHGPILLWLVAALVLYGAAVVITMAVNVPLNNALDAAGHPDRAANLAEVRKAFEATWVRWNLVRAGTATAGFACLTWALVLHGRATA
ncbi:MAG TPA: anthrone oxygenase family protein [Pseudonocardiaceae bacterium]|nr:anthrone oxygenase family protein [Pseudonocardiaceae bacterium]